MKRRVLVTRPEPGASETATRLAEAGFVALVLPLTEIVPAAPDPFPDPDGCDVVTATSANAMRHVPAALLAGLANKPLFAVGETTARAARQAGFRTVRTAAGTATDLAALIAAETKAGARVLHLAGRDRTAGFAEELRRSGFAVSIAELYRAEEVSQSTDFVERLLGGGPAWGAPVFSTRGGALLAALARRPQLRKAFENTCYFCISQKAADPLREAGLPRVTVSDEPTEESVLLLLSSRS